MNLTVLVIAIDLNQDAFDSRNKEGLSMVQASLEII